MSDPEDGIERARREQQVAAQKEADDATRTSRAGSETPRSAPPRAAPQQRLQREAESRVEACLDQPLGQPRTVKDTMNG